MPIAIVTISLFYVVPVVVSYFGIRHRYKEKMIQPNFHDFLLAFLPVLNWEVTLDITIGMLTRCINRFSKATTSTDNYKKKSFLSRFFRL